MEPAAKQPRTSRNKRGNSPPRTQRAAAGSGSIDRDRGQPSGTGGDGSGVSSLNIGTGSLDQVHAGLSKLGAYYYEDLIVIIIITAAFHQKWTFPLCFRVSILLSSLQDANSGGVPPPATPASNFILSHFVLSQPNAC